MKTRLFLTILLLVSTAVSCIKAPTPEPPPGEEIESKIISFSILKKDNPKLSNDIVFENITQGKFCAYLNDIKDVTSLVATFELSNKLSNEQLLVGNVVQESGKTANNFTNVVNYKYKQDDGKIIEYQITLIPYTGLPLLFITTKDGKTPTNKVDWKKATLKIIDLNGNYDCNDMEMEIRLRGNSTMSYPKKPFNIKLSQKASMFGMPKHKRWSLLANYRDRSLLRTYTALHIGQNLSGLEWTSKSHFVEVIFNGEYVGNYQFTEQIRIDNDRVDIDEMTSVDISGDNLTGGYLLEINKRYDEVNKFKTEILDMPVCIKEPDESEFKSQHLEYITNYFNLIEKAMVDSEFSRAYNDLLDINSFIDCWFAYEIPANTEISGQYSCYLYKKRNGKLFAGPIWDYDYSFNIKDQVHAVGHPWFKLLLNDPIFKDAAKKRFDDIKPFLMMVPDFIESQREYMRLSNIQNERLWAPREGYTGGKDEKMSYDESINYLISFYKEQVEWFEKYLNE